MGWWMFGRQFIALRPAYQHAAEVVYDDAYPDCGGRSLQAWAARRWLVTKRLARWLAWRDARAGEQLEAFDPILNIC
jgi:hypothetical protein